MTEDWTAGREARVSESSCVKVHSRGCFQMLPGPELDLGIITALQLDG